jgi:hypothetical protein
LSVIAATTSGLNVQKEHKKSLIATKTGLLWLSKLFWEIFHVVFITGGTRVVQVNSENVCEFSDFI